MRLRPTTLADGALALAVVGAVLLVVFPVPTPVLDVLLAGQLALAVTILLTAVGAPHALALSQFPTVLLLTTLLRLALNVSTTRLVLAQGDAGRVVAAFGEAVVGGEVLVGAAVFAVITLVQFLVIAQGAERVAQVGARFALDGLPGRQLAIDADLRAGLLDPEGARARRAALTRESSLFGAMDGAMRFVKGDAVVGLAIVGVNVLGGLAMGVGRLGLDFDEAVRRYTLLTVGDGLLAQLPAVLTATAAALLVTRVEGGEGRGPARAIAHEFANDSRVLSAAALCMAVLGALPGLPLLPLWAVAAALAGLAWTRRRPLAPTAPAPARTVTAPAPLGLALHPDAVRALAPVSPAHILAAARRRLAADFGIDAPAATLRTDGGGLGPGEYRIEAGEAPRARGALPIGMIHAAPAPTAHLKAPEPTTGAPGGWLVSGAGLTAAAYLEARLVAVWRQAGAVVLGVQAVAARLTDLEADQPALVRAVVPRVLDAPALARLLQALAAEGVPVRDLRAVLEALTGRPPDEGDAARLQAVRRALAPVLLHRLAPGGHFEALHADHHLERALRRGPLDAALAAEILDQLEAALSQHPRAAWVVPADLRPAARQLTERRLPGLPVLAHDEVAPPTRAIAVAVISGE